MTSVVTVDNFALTFLAGALEPVDFIFFQVVTCVRKVLVKKAEREKRLLILKKSFRVSQNVVEMVFFEAKSVRNKRNQDVSVVKRKTLQKLQVGTQLSKINFS